MSAAGLRQIASGGDTKFGGERLKKHGDEAAEENHAQQGVAELRAAAEIGSPAAGIQITAGYEIAETREGKHVAPERSARNNLHAVNSFWKRETSGIDR